MADSALAVVVGVQVERRTSSRQESPRFGWDAVIMQRAHVDPSFDLDWRKGA